VHLNSVESRKERARRAHQSDYKLKRNLKVIEYLRGDTMHKKHREAELLRTLSSSTRWALSQCKCAQKNSMLSLIRNKVIEHSVRKISARSASSRRMPGGREEFILNKSFETEFDEIPRTQGVCGRSKYLRRSSSGGVTQKVHRSRTCSKSISSEETTLS
jgi:hypothetical protein